MTRRTPSPLRRPIYAVGTTYRDRGGLRQVSPSVLWGCGFLTAMICVAMCLGALIAVPVGFSLLPADTQARIAGRLPFLRNLQPTREVVELPTLDPIRATDAAALLLNTGGAANPATTNQGGRAATQTPLPRPTATFEPVQARFRLDNVRWEPQKWNNCGPANLVQAMRVMGVEAPQQDVAAWVKPNTQDANVSPWQLAAYANQFTNLRAIVRVNGDVNLLKRLVLNKFGVVVETGYADREDGQWEGHYLTIIGWDDDRSYFYGLDTLYNGDDPLGVHENYADLDQRWQQFNRAYLVLYRPDQEGKLRQLLGNAWDEQTNYREALNKAQIEAQYNRANPFAWFNIGTNLVALGDYEQAASAFDAARSVGGGLPWRMMWYQFGPYVAYYHVGRYDEMIKLADNTLRNTKNIEETLYFRGLANAALGATSTAVDELQRAFSYNPNFTPAQTALNQLRNGDKPQPAVF